MSGIIKKRIPRNRQGSLSRRAIQFIEKELAGDQGSASNASPAPTQTTPTHRPNDYSPKALADTYPTLGPTALQCYDRITAAIDGSSDDAVFSAFPRVPHLGALLAATHTAGYGERWWKRTGWAGDRVAKTIAKELLLDRYRERQYSRLRTSGPMIGGGVTEDDARRRKLMDLCDELKAECDSTGQITRISRGTDSQTLSASASSGMRSLVTHVAQGDAPQTVTQSRLMSASDLDTALGLLHLSEFVMEDAGGRRSLTVNKPHSVQHASLLCSWIIEAAHAVASRSGYASTNTETMPRTDEAMSGASVAHQ